MAPPRPSEDTTPTDARFPSHHDLTTAQKQGADEEDESGPTIASPEYMRHLATKIGVVHLAVARVERSTAENSREATAAGRAARDAKTAAEAAARSIETLHVEMRGAFAGFARSHDTLATAILPLVASKAEWKGAKAVAARIGGVFAALGALGGLVVGALKVFEALHH